MIFPEYVDRVCMVKEIEGNIALIILDPNGGVGSVMLTQEETIILIERLMKCSEKVREFVKSSGE